MLRWKIKVEPGGLESIRHGLGGHHTTEPLTHRSLPEKSTLPAHDLLPFLTGGGSTWPKQGHTEAVGEMGWWNAKHFVCVYSVFQITQVSVRHWWGKPPNYHGSV